MKERDWMELQQEAPYAVNACLLYFQERYMGHWRSKVMDAHAILTYLGGLGFEITVSTFGLPNRDDWYYEVFRNDVLLRHERGFADFERAALAALGCAFLELERAY